MRLVERQAVQALIARERGAFAVNGFRFYTWGRCAGNGSRWGRKTVFTATMIIFGVANGAMAFSWTLGMLLAARFVIGLGLGAELPVASTLVSEFSRVRILGSLTALALATGRTPLAASK